MKRVSGLHLVGGLSTEASGGNRPAELDRAALTQLLKERRYEEALEIVLKARQQNPNDPAVSRSVRLLKDRLTLQYSERVGGLDGVPECRLSDDVIDSMTFSFEERGVLALVDGIATFGDIVDASPHGGFATYRALASFLEREVIHARGNPASPVRAKGVQPQPPPQPRAKVPSLPDWSAPPVPDDPAQLVTTWDEEEPGDLRREDTQPMYVMPALPPEPAPEPYLPSPMEEFELPAHPPLPSPRAVEPEPPPPPAGPAVAAAPKAAPVPPSPAVDYDALFDRATRAYVRRDYEEAMTLFQQYLVVRPNDRRAHHNLEQLRKRRKGS